ncbi:MAG: hypothetical protein WC781_01570 [Candidatus Pacearchaeota archaeon]|jgi:hypothetical protein
MTKKLETHIIELIATDRISIPIKSMAGKLDRAKPKLGYKVVESMELEDNYFGDRVYARISYEDEMKARGMREGIEVFSEKFPRYGTILNGIIEEKRAEKEKHLYFGMNEGCKLTAGDYREVMAGLGFNSNESEQLYPRLMEISRKLSRARNEERSILVG